MKKLILPLFAISLFAASCKKNLDLLPTDSITSDLAFTSVDDLEKGLMNVYSFNSITNRIYIAGLLSDELKLSNENRGQGQFTFKWQFSSSGSEHNADWDRYAFMIDRIHRVLAAAEKITPTAQADIDRKNRIIAELTGLRAVAYYEILIRFMPNNYNPAALGVPVVTGLVSPSDKPSRNTVGDVMNRIVEDLGTARSSTLIPDAPTDILRLSKSAIAAYQARAALLRRDWPAAITFASDAITLSGKTLATGQTYAEYWQDLNESETIWKFKNNNAPQLVFRDANGDVFFEPADKLKNQFDRTNDIRFDIFFGSAAGDTSIVTKYPGGPAGPQINDLKLIRLSEMYLLRAEAYAENNQLGLAADDLNDVRAARITGYTDVTFGSKEQAIEQILNERYKELAFEGFRFFDLKRRGLGVARDASDVQSSEWQNLDANDYRFALPIPQREMDANENMQQNPGYN